MGKSIAGCLGVLAAIATILGLLLALGLIHNPFASRFGTGYYKIQNRSSRLFLEVNANPGNPLRNSNGGRVDQWGDQNAPNEEWMIVDTGDGYYKIQNRYSNLFLEVKGLSSGDTADQWADENAPSEEWGIDDSGGGYYYFINRSSNLVLEAQGSYNGGTVDQSAQQNTPNEEWMLVPEG